MAHGAGRDRREGAPAAGVRRRSPSCSRDGASGGGCAGRWPPRSEPAGSRPRSSPCSRARHGGAPRSRADAAACGSAAPRGSSPAPARAGQPRDGPLAGWPTIDDPRAAGSSARTARRCGTPSRRCRARPRRAGAASRRRRGRLRARWTWRTRRSQVACWRGTAARSRARSRWSRTAPPSSPRSPPAIYPQTGRAAHDRADGRAGRRASRRLAAELVAGRARRRTDASRCSRSTRPRRSPAGRSSATASGCRSTPPTPACSSARWPRAATSAAWRSPRPRRSGSSTRRGTTWSIVETVGVGQAEVEVAAADRHDVVVLAPGLGDAVQMAKAGILEIADVFVVNKADRDGAGDAVRELRQMLHLGAAPRVGRRRSLATSAADRRRASTSCGTRSSDHRAYLGRVGRRSRTGGARGCSARCEALAAERLGGRPAGRCSPARRRARRRPRATRRIDPYRAAAMLIADGAPAAADHGDGAMP